MARRRFLVTATPPTTNGDLHLGHLSGPYLAGDVFARAQRMQGNEVLFVSGGDDNQTYVVTTAERLGLDPLALAAQSTREILLTLDAAYVEMDAFTTPNMDYTVAVQSFFLDLERAGKLERRRWSFSFSERTGRVLLEAFTQGYCPECFVSTSGAICEVCGHPNDASSLLFAHSGVADDDKLGTRSAEILVLPLEKYRSQLEAFYAARQSSIRPHVLRLVDEMLSKPLPDFPISYPASWGIPIPIDGFDGQVLNVWAEMFPGLRYMSDIAHSGLPAPVEHGPWGEKSGFEIVQFLGYDNTFYFAIVHLCLAFAHGGMALPSAIITNEFYFLEGSKFSTSRRHLIWARNLLAKYGADEVRFFLALDSPEHQSTNFSIEAFVEAVEGKLFAPLDAIGVLVRSVVGQPLPEISEAEDSIIGHYSDRMISAYDPNSFSLRRAAEATSNLLIMAADRAEYSVAFAIQAVKKFCELAEPITPGLSHRIAERFASCEGNVPDLTDLRPLIMKL